MQVDDKLIIGLLTANDPRGMEFMFTCYYRPLVLWTDTILNDIPAAEDLVQEFLVDFWQQHVYERISSGGIRGYVFMAVRNRALKLLEKRDPLREASAELPEKDDGCEANWWTEEMIQTIEAEINKLPPRMKEILNAVYINGLSYRETAEKLGISVATVKTSLVTALKRIRSVFFILLSFVFKRK